MIKITLDGINSSFSDQVISEESDNSKIAFELIDGDENQNKLNITWFDEKDKSIIISLSKDQAILFAQVLNNYVEELNVTDSE